MTALFRLKNDVATDETRILVSDGKEPNGLSGDWGMRINSGFQGS